VHASIDANKAAVRPTVTGDLVVVQAGLAVAWTMEANAEQALAAFGPFTMMA
jgi:hypothetical protein